MFSIMFPSPGWLKRWPPRSPWWAQRRYQQVTLLLLLTCLVGVFGFPSTWATGQFQYILSYFRRSADDKMWRREVDAQLRLGGSLNPVQPPDPGFLASGPTSGVSRPQSSSPTMGTECWHDARLTHDTHSLCILSVSSSSLSQVQDRAVSLKL